jgi:hypothetical protein
MNRLTTILIALLLLAGVAYAETTLGDNIETWLTEEDFEVITYEDSPDTWYISLEGNNIGAVPCIIYLSEGFICFRSELVTIPAHNHGDLNELTRELLDIGLRNYLVKAVLNDAQGIEIEAEFPAGDLSRQDFVDAVWLVLNTADAEYAEIIKYVYN